MISDGIKHTFYKTVLQFLINVMILLGGTVVFLLFLAEWLTDLP